jgi:hypothetical protein
MAVVGVGRSDPWQKVERSARRSAGDTAEDGDGSFKALIAADLRDSGKVSFAEGQIPGGAVEER